MDRPLSNADIARKLLDIRALMEFAGEPFFKFTAYERAAVAVENAPPVADLIAVGRVAGAAGRRQDDRRAHHRDRNDRDQRILRRARGRVSADA